MYIHLSLSLYIYIYIFSLYINSAAEAAEPVIPG